MSLDVSLYMTATQLDDADIFFEEDWLDEDGELEVFTANITHNLNKMAREAGLYEALWEGKIDGSNVETAYELIDVLKQGLSILKQNRSYFEEFNPKNGWGAYDGLLYFVTEYLAACQKYSEARIYISR